MALLPCTLPPKSGTSPLPSTSSRSAYRSRDEECRWSHSSSSGCEKWSPRRGSRPDRGRRELELEGQHRGHAAASGCRARAFKSCSGTVNGRHADLNSKDTNGATPLHLVAKNGNLAMTIDLTKADAGLDSKDKEGTTALHLAAERGNPRVLAVLIKAGAYLNPKDTSGATSLLLAAERGQSDGSTDRGRRERRHL